MPAEYKSYQIAAPSVPFTGQPQKMFSGSKPYNNISAWTILVQYQYGSGDPAPLPPANTVNEGAWIQIFGTVNGADNINNVIFSSQKYVPIVGGLYRAYGREIIVQTGQDAGPAVTLNVSAIEESLLQFDTETVYADATVQAVIPQFSTSFAVSKDGTIRVQDFTGNTLDVVVAIAGVYYPIHPMAYLVEESAAINQTVYSFKKGYL